MVSDIQHHTGKIFGFTKKTGGEVGGSRGWGDTVSHSALVTDGRREGTDHLGQPAGNMPGKGCGLCRPQLGSGSLKQ